MLQLRIPHAEIINKRSHKLKIPRATKTRHNQINRYLLKSQNSSSQGQGLCPSISTSGTSTDSEKLRTLSLGMWEKEGEKLADGPVRSGLELFPEREPGKPAGLPGSQRSEMKPSCSQCCVT
ncbi:unnamed protein product [Rangifer tarandus platyrhynchus]|uniref:Uncharacterized protein n=1 Tax=Rangifer tarandus platyrhynchus TaxID=3082113 RepID=A0AC60A4C2_RANTA